MARFPKTLYAKWESGGSGQDYICTYDTECETAEMGEKIKVGVYQLVETRTVEGIVKTHKR
jgi:hypothetical protein